MIELGRNEGGERR